MFDWKKSQKKFTINFLANRVNLCKQRTTFTLACPPMYRTRRFWYIFLSRIYQNFLEIENIYWNILKCSSIRSVIHSRTEVRSYPKTVPAVIFMNQSFVGVEPLEGLETVPENGTIFFSKSVIWPRHTRIRLGRTEKERKETFSRVVKQGSEPAALRPEKWARPCHLGVL